MTELWDLTHTHRLKSPAHFDVLFSNSSLQTSLLGMVQWESSVGVNLWATQPPLCITKLVWSRRSVPFLHKNLFVLFIHAEDVFWLGLPEVLEVQDYNYNYRQQSNLVPGLFQASSAAKVRKPWHWNFEDCGLLEFCYRPALNLMRFRLVRKLVE